MAGSINDFRASFKTDFARPARFDVEIPIPLKLVQYINVAKQLTFRCENAELPGKTFATTERRIYGPTEKQPYLVTFNDITLTFIVSDDMQEKGFFDAWMGLINPKSTFDMNYKSDYVTPITINQYDVTNNLSYSVTLREAYPISINQLDLDWSNENTHHKLAVTFAYYTWETNSLASFAQDLIDSGISTGVDMATNAITAISQGTSFNPLKPDTGGTVYDMNSIAGAFNK